MLIGAETLDELRERAHQVFARFDYFGIKVNYDKVKWVSETIQFLGCEVGNAHWSHENFLKKKLAELGRVETIKDLENIIGVISYTRRCVKDVEMILGPLREDLKIFKAGKVTEVWMNALNEKVKEALRKAILNVKWLILPGVDAKQFVFVIETDWSSSHEGYMLFASRNGEERLLDIGSRMQQSVVSSCLGELDALVWACKRTKAFRGTIPVVVRTYSQALVEKWKSLSLYESHIRIFRR